ARDMEFALASKMNDELWFVLASNEETLKRYPYQFSLMIGYRITGRKVRVMWNVMNHDNRMIYFSIGGHPAFLSPVEGAAIEFDVHGPITAGVLEYGLLSDRTKSFALDGGRMALSYDIFQEDALIFEDQEIRRAALLDPDGTKVLELLFNSPLLGIWTPVGKNAPVVCIEPWYGRTDRSSFAGELSERELGNALKPSEVFSTHYDIIV
ncbi:MAG: aldose 1-epimerase family protein, partial [Lachnospiraceae bacterium]|nr:aldose 1-epimerase family protein [Lachnospiraceae bacterium]